MAALISFMNGPVGRLVRIALGIAIAYVAVTMLDGPAQWAVAAVSLVPIVLGVSGRCLIELVPGRR